MSDNQTIVIVGASLAGAKAAETLRQEGFAGRVVLIGEEPDRPYERPALSKGYVRGDDEAAKIFVHDAGFYTEQAIDLRTATRVAAIDPGTSEVVLEGGERLPYDRLLLTTGAAPRRLALPGANLPGVHYLRGVGDADRLGLAIRQASRVDVIGAGWIGSEVAASVRQMGAEVAMVDPGAVPLARVMGPEVGAVFRQLHASHGVELYLGSGVEAVVGTEAATGVRTADGRLIEADLVVVGIGVVPARNSPKRRESRSATASRSTSTSRRLFPGSSPPATWPPPGTPVSVSGCGSSTGPTP